jgi:hypothetical protein
MSGSEPLFMSVIVTPPWSGVIDAYFLVSNKGILDLDKADIP